MSANGQNRLRVLSLLDAKLSDLIASQAPDADLVRLPPDQPVPAGESADVLIALASAPALRDLKADVGWVHIHSTGVDAVPADVYTDRVVTCSRGATAGPVAEFAVAAMLAYEKQLPEIWVDEPPDNWGYARLGELSGRRLAVLGLGHVGSAVARLGLTFGMQVQALRRTTAPPPLLGIAVSTTVAAAMAGADHVVVAAPATAQTHHLLDDAAFAAMKPGAHLVNVARGSLVDQDALRRALDSGQVARASLDTCEPEPLPAGHWMYAHPGVRLSPHVAWSSSAMGRRMVEHFLTNLGSRLRGAPLQGVIDPRAGY